MDALLRSPVAAAVAAVVVVAIVVALVVRSRRRSARRLPPAPIAEPAPPPEAAYLDSSHIIEGPIVGGPSPPEPGRPPER